MGLQVEIRAGEQMHRMPLLAADDQILSRMSGERFCEVLWQSRVEEQLVDRVEFLNAATALVEDLKKVWNVLPYRYSFEHQIRNDVWKRKMRGSGCWQGFRINGKMHSIEGGVGRCFLTELEIADNRITRMEHHDVRGQKVIETDSDGPIRLFRSKLKVSLLEQLQATIDFLQRAPEAQVRVQLTEGPRTTLQLIRAITEEDDEGAKEELFNRGQSAKQELLAMLSAKRTRKHHATIAYLLLMLFPSPESRAAVEQLAEKETDPTRQEEFATLLALITRK